MKSHTRCESSNEKITLTLGDVVTIGRRYTTSLQQQKIYQASYGQSALALNVGTRTLGGRT